MASSKMTEKETNAINRRVKELCQRMRGIFPCPLTQQNWIALRESALKPEVVQAFYTVIKSREVDRRHVAVSQIRIALMRGKDTLAFHVGSEDEVFIGKSISSRDVSATLQQAAQVIGDERVAALVRWHSELLEQINAANRAVTVISDLLDMASTVGQFARMVPEIVPLLSADNQAIVASQEKASRLPDRWAAYPRQPVYDAMDFLTKCHLLPPIVPREYGCNALGFMVSDVFPE